MFCISFANLRKWVKIPYNLLKVNEDFEGERNDKIHFLFNLLLAKKAPMLYRHSIFHPYRHLS